jgi:hypothetical protein
MGLASLLRSLMNMIDIMDMMDMMDKGRMGRNTTGVFFVYRPFYFLTPVHIPNSVFLFLLPSPFAFLSSSVTFTCFSAKRRRLH